MVIFQDKWLRSNLIDRDQSLSLEHFLALQLLLEAADLSSYQILLELYKILVASTMVGVRKVGQHLFLLPKKKV